MRCPACLAEAIGSGKYCAACGTRIPQEAAPAAPVAAEATAAPAVPSPEIMTAPTYDAEDIALSKTDLPPPSIANTQDGVDPFASTADPGANHLNAAELVAAHSSDAGRVSPLASSSFDLGGEPGEPPKGPLPAAGNPAVKVASAAGPNSAAPRSRQGSTVLLSAMPMRGGAIGAQQPPVPAAPPTAPTRVPPVAPAPVPAPAQPQAAYGYGAPPASSYGHAPAPASRHVAPPSSAHIPAVQSAPGAGAPGSGVGGLQPGGRVIVTFPNGQRVFGTIWQCAQAHYLVKFPDGQSQWVDIAFVRPV